MIRRPAWRSPRLALVFMAAFTGGCGGGDQGRNPEFDGAAAFARLSELVALGPRFSGSFAMKAQNEIITRTLTEAGATVITQEFQRQVLDSTEMVTLTNLIGRFRPELAARVVLVTHHDSRREAERDPDPSLRHLAILGANDSGSGTAILLELARAFGTSPPPVGVDLVFCDGEEWGKPGRGGYCQGSRHLEATFRDVYPTPPRWAVCIDMVGDADLEILMERSGLSVAREFSDRVFALAAELGLPAFKAEPGESIEDDHSAFQRRGVPAILLIDYHYKSPDGTVEYYHTHGDTLERCSAESLDQVGTLLAALVAREAP